MNEKYLDTLDEGELSLVNWQYGLNGSFFTGLWDAIKNADRLNLQRLSLSFPSHVEAFIRFTTEKNYWTDMQKKLFAKD